MLSPTDSRWIGVLRLNRIKPEETGMNQDQDTVTLLEEMEAEIRSVAHKIWEDEGKPEGLAHDHWARATAIVTTAAELEGGLGSPNWLQKAPTPEVELAPAPDVEERSLSQTLEQLKRRVAGRSAA